MKSIAFCQTLILKVEPKPKGNQPGDSEDIVVFSIRRDTKYAECGQELVDGNLLRMDGERPLCLDCADLGHLEFLPSGNTALTRRASKYSPLRAVVVRWSRTRNRYERRGILVSPSAIAQAETECLADDEQESARHELPGKCFRASKGLASTTTFDFNRHRCLARLEDKINFLISFAPVNRAPSWTGILRRFVPRRCPLLSHSAPEGLAGVYSTFDRLVGRVFTKKSALASGLN